MNVANNDDVETLQYAGVTRKSASQSDSRVGLVTADEDEDVLPMLRFCERQGLALFVLAPGDRCFGVFCGCPSRCSLCCWVAQRVRNMRGVFEHQATPQAVNNTTTHT